MAPTSLGTLVFRHVVSHSFASDHPVRPLSRTHPAGRICSVVTQPVRPRGLCPQKAPCSMEGSDVAVLRHLKIFEREARHVHFARGPQMGLPALPGLRPCLSSCSLHGEACTCALLLVRTSAGAPSGRGQPPQACSRLSSGLPQPSALTSVSALVTQNPQGSYLQT